MSRKLCITSADGQTGHLIAELILTDDTFSSKIAELTLLALHPEKCQDLADLGAKVVPHKPGNVKALTQSLKESGADTILMIPPAHKQKLKLAEEMLTATREAGVNNTVLLSSAGADLGEDEQHPRLREFIKIESMFMESKGLDTTPAGNSPCVIRAGFYAENLLLYNKDAQKNQKLRLPIGPTHKFAPVALGDIAQVAAHVLTGEGPHGLDDRHRGQLIVLTGPMMCSGTELAEAAKQAGLNLEFEDISEEEAKEILDADAELDESEKEYLLEYYSLVRAGKTNYVSTIAFTAITGEKATEPTEFFKTYDAEFKPKRRRLRK
ncbi:NAD(P)-binding protein [Heliocybe sulcata]|uniref:NAD(P)-binding protein n=1 Tax=Heliocybe sulcata TaxID=5364 RepID=A0A5C3NDN0_9AGAM|nr:NAD(P)-binding protein [Heliocybe sulcata]